MEDFQDRSDYIATALAQKFKLIEEEIAPPPESEELILQRLQNLQLGRELIFSRHLRFFEQPDEDCDDTTP